MLMLLYLFFGQINKTEKQSSISFPNPVEDCSNRFWSINSSGHIVEWIINNDSIIAGDSLLSESGTSLAHGGDPCEPTFYTVNHNLNNLFNYYDENEGWIAIDNDQPLINMGAYNEHLYFMVLDINGLSARELVYFDGQTFTMLDTFPESRFAVADIAVDSSGHAWIFTGASPTFAEQVRIYNPEGIIDSFPAAFYSSHGYGSFFLGDQLYIGFGESNSVFGNTLVQMSVLNDSVVIDGSIPFQNQTYFDLAGCQVCNCVTNTEEITTKTSITIYPNPSHDFLNIESSIPIEFVELYAVNGAFLKKVSGQNQIDIKDYPSGTYLLKISVEQKIISKLFIKE